VYSDSTAVLGPLATYAEPHSYDLCLRHAGRLSVPRGWAVLRLPVDGDDAAADDDLLALADAVREGARPLLADHSGRTVEVARRRHLRMVRSPEPGPSQAPADSPDP
jgi:hypothetical protein